MTTAPRSTLGRWLFALKPASWPKLLVPAALGQAIGIDATGSVSFLGLALGALFVVCDLVFVVMLNDWGDREVDAIKRRMFPETSPKTIPDGVLPGGVLLLVGLAAGLGALAVAGVSSVALDRPLAVPLALASLGLFCAYTLPPLRLNYRGGGELLEMLGVGVVLPVVSGYFQSGELVSPSSVVLVGFAPLALASAVASGLSDERSDRAGGKRTVVGLVGNERARALVLVLGALGPALWLAEAALLSVGPPAIVLLATAITAADEWPALRRASPAAVTDAFGAQAAFKERLHALAWRSGLACAASLVLAVWIGL